MKSLSDIAYRLKIYIVLATAAMTSSGCQSGPRAPSTPSSPAGGILQPGQTAAEARQSGERFARNYWYEITSDGAVGRSWMIPHCEPQQSGILTRFKPTSPGAEKYSSQPETTVRQSALYRALTQAIDEAARAQSLSPLTPDRRLDIAATDLLNMLPRNRRLPARLVDFTVQRQGAIGTSPIALVMWGDIDHVPSMVGQLRPQLPGLFAGRSPNRIGLSVKSRPDWGFGVGVVVFLFQDSHVHLRAVAREASGDTSVQLVGRVEAPLQSPRVHIQHSVGDRQMPRHLRADDRAFATTIACGGFHGRKQIDIIAQRRDRPVLLASFPLWCNRPEPDSLALDVAGEVIHKSRSEERAESYIARAVNRERRRCGLNPLTTDSGFRAVARAYSHEVQRTAQLAHRSKTTGTPQERAASVEPNSATVHEFLGRTFSLAELQSELMNNFEYRAALLSANITHLGVGVARTGTQDYPELVVTQMFVGIPDAIDLAQVRSMVRNKMNEKRSFNVHSDLAQHAQQAADRLAAGALTSSVVDQTIRSLRHIDTSFRTAKLHVWKGADVADFQPPAEILTRDLSHVGIGVARGPATDDRHRLDFYITLVLGTPPDRAESLESGL